MADDKPTSQTAPSVKVRNVSRRPLLFRAPGRTIRLSAGEEIDVPDSWLLGVELRRLCEGGLVATTRIAPPQATAAGEEPPPSPASEPESTVSTSRTADAEETYVPPPPPVSPRRRRE